MSENAINVRLRYYVEGSTGGNFWVRDRQIKNHEGEAYIVVGYSSRAKADARAAELNGVNVLVETAPDLAQLTAEWAHEGTVRYCKHALKKANIYPHRAVVPTEIENVWEASHYNVPVPAALRGVYEGHGFHVLSVEQKTDQHDVRYNAVRFELPYSVQKPSPLQQLAAAQIEVERLRAALDEIIAKTPDKEPTMYGADMYDRSYYARGLR